MARAVFSVSGTFLVIAGPTAGSPPCWRAAGSGELPARAGPGLGSGRSDRFRTAIWPGRECSLRSRASAGLPFLANEMALLGAEAAGHRGRAARERAYAALKLAGVFHLEKRMMSKLSGGGTTTGRHRILAQLDGRTEDRLCVSRRTVVSSLDLAHQHELLARAKSLARAGAVVVVVLHDLNLAARYADEIILPA